MSALPAGRLPWWTLDVPTADGARYLACHYAFPRHYAARVPADTIVACHACRLTQRGHVWASPDQTVVVCGACHWTQHATNAPDVEPDDTPAGQITGQLTL